MSASHHHVISGYDGSKIAAAAARWAAGEARRRDCGLTVIGCYAMPVVTDFGRSVTGMLTADIDAQRKRTEDSLAALVGDLRERHPELAVNAVALPGSAREVLLEQATHADLLVIGATGTGELASLLLGSVAFAMLRISPCPVVIVPREHVPAEPSRVVVGIDTVESSRRALEWAVDEADLLGAEITIVHTWSYPYGAGASTTIARDVVQVDAACELDRAVELAELRGGGKVDRRLAEGDPAEEIVATAEGADLVVIGSRGRGSLRAMFLGSVSNAVVAHAPCPTAVVRTIDEERTP